MQNNSMESTILQFIEVDVENIIQKKTLNFNNTKCFNICFWNLQCVFDRVFTSKRDLEMRKTPFTGMKSHESRLVILVMWIGFTINLYNPQFKKKRFWFWDKLSHLIERHWTSQGNKLFYRLFKLYFTFANELQIICITMRKRKRAKEESDNNITVLLFLLCNW